MNGDVNGERIIRADVALTALFAITAAYAAIDFSTSAQWIGAVTAMTLFAIGVFAFLWSFWNAVQRSRSHDIAVSQLYLLLGPAIPSRVRRIMNLTLLAQWVIAAVTTFSRPDGPDGNPGSSLAVGFLVPMLGFGLNGLWAVTYGNFRERPEGTTVTSGGTAGGAANGTTSEHRIGQNAEHG